MQVDLNQVFGTTVMAQLRDWSISVYADDKAATVAQYQQPSWNFRSILPRLGVQTFPLKLRPLTNAAPTTVTPGGGGSMYATFGVAAGGTAGVSWSAGSTNVTFVTIEDETGVANAIIWQQKFEAQRRIVLSAAMINVKGRLQREGEVIHVIADRLEDHTSLLHSVGAMQFPHRPSPGDGATHGGPDPRGTIKPRVLDLYPAPRPRRTEESIPIKSRDFH
jgi:hypothetical protein